MIEAEFVEEIGEELKAIFDAETIGVEQYLNKIIRVDFTRMPFVSHLNY